MIIGQVNHRYEAVIAIQLGAFDNPILNLDAVIDTGFSGYRRRTLITDELHIMVQMPNTPME